VPLALPARTRPFPVPAGSYTKLALSVTQLSFLDLRSGALVQRCAANDAARLALLGGRYSLASCRLECLLNASRAACRCLPALDRRTLANATAALPLCTSAQLARCLAPHVASAGGAAALAACRQACLPPCDDLRCGGTSQTGTSGQLAIDRYEASTSGAPLNPDAFPAAAGADGEGGAGELVLLDAALEHVETASFSQNSSMTFDFFVGNMGSQVTLWIGGCMLTLLPLPLSMLAFCCMAGVVRLRRSLAL